MPKKTRINTNTLIKKALETQSIQALQSVVQCLSPKALDLFDYTQPCLNMILSTPNQTKRDLFNFFSISDFERFLNLSLNVVVMHDVYLTDLQIKAKRSGRIVEYALLIDWLEKQFLRSIWTQEGKVFYLIFHALQQPLSKFDGDQFLALLRILNYKLCLITEHQHIRLGHLSVLSGREKEYIKFSGWYQLHLVDLRNISVSSPTIPETPSSTK